VADDGQIIRFKIGEAFPADEPLARWMTVCAMAANDLILVNRWLLPKLKEEEPSEAYETVYLGRLAAAHLFEAAKFLKKTDKRLAVVRELVAGLNQDAQAAYQQLLAIGDGGSNEQMKHARNMFFHYPALLPPEKENHEPLKQAMAGHAADEEEKGIERGKIEDIPPSITGFRSFFADDVAVEMMMPGDTEKELPVFLGSVSEHIAAFMLFLKEVFNEYTQTRPDGTWHLETLPTAGNGTWHVETLPAAGIDQPTESGA
jgi:hypothetical protein